MTIVGAGIIGISCALYLQQRGHRVRVLDPLGPAGGASRGHSGGIAVTWVSPQGLPGMLREAAGWIRDPLGPVSIRAAYLPRLMPWLLRLNAARGRVRVEAIADALKCLMDSAYDDWIPLLETADLGDQVQHTGALTLYDSRAERERQSVAWELRRARAYQVEYLDARDIRDLEPAVSTRFVCGVLEPQCKFVRDPFHVAQRLAASIVDGGGTVSRERVSAVAGVDGVVTTITTDLAEYDVDVLLIAAGAWSHRLTRALGDPVPLESERGYSVTLPSPGLELRHIVSVAAHKMTITPMTEGLRLAGTAEFAGLDAPPNYGRAEALLCHGRQSLPGLQVGRGTQWAGDRPILPDSLPVLGRATRYRNAYYAFGHSHIGFTLAGTTGRVMADLIDGDPPGIDLAPFRPERFLGRVGHLRSRKRTGTRR